VEAGIVTAVAAVGQGLRALLRYFAPVPDLAVSPADTPPLLVPDAVEVTRVAAVLGQAGAGASVIVIADQVFAVSSEELVPGYLYCF